MHKKLIIRKLVVVVIVVVVVVAAAVTLLFDNGITTANWSGTPSSQPAEGRQTSPYISLKLTTSSS